MTARVRIASTMQQALPQAPRVRAKRKPKLSLSEIERLISSAKASGLEIAALEAIPGRVRIITTAGRNLTLASDSAEDNSFDE